MPLHWQPDTDAELLSKIRNLRGDERSVVVWSSTDDSCRFVLYPYKRTFESIWIGPSKVPRYLYEQFGYRMNRRIQKTRVNKLVIQGDSDVLCCCYLFP